MNSKRSFLPSAICMLNGVPWSHPRLVRRIEDGAEGFPGRCNRNRPHAVDGRLLATMGMAAAHAGAFALHQTVLRSDGSPASGVGGCEQGNGWDAEACSKVQRAGVSRDKNPRSAKDGKVKIEAGCGREQGGCGFLGEKFGDQGLLALARTAGEYKRHASSGCSSIEFEPAGDRPFLLRLTRGEVSDHGPFSEESGCCFFVGGIRVNLQFVGFRKGNTELLQQMGMPYRFVDIRDRKKLLVNGMRVTEAATRESQRSLQPNALLGSDNQTDERAAVIAHKVHGKREMLPAEQGQQRQGRPNLRVASFAREPPCTGDPRQMLDNRKGVLCD